MRRKLKKGISTLAAWPCLRAGRLELLARRTLGIAHPRHPGPGFGGGRSHDCELQLLIGSCSWWKIQP